MGKRRTLRTRVLTWVLLGLLCGLPPGPAMGCGDFAALNVTRETSKTILLSLAQMPVTRRDRLDRFNLAKAFAIARQAPHLLESAPDQARFMDTWEALVRSIAARATPEQRIAMAKVLIGDLKSHPLDWTVQPRLDRVIDTILGMDGDAVTQRIKGLDPIEVAKRYGKENTWYEYDNSLLLTPYFEFQLALEHLKPRPGQTFVDLGSGMGRMGLYMGMIHPGVKFHGYEIVGERVKEGARVAKDLSIPDVHFHEQNMADKSWKPEPADYYYAFNPVSDATFDKILQDMKDQAIKHNKPFKLAVSGPAPYFKLEAASAWLKEITPPPRFKGDDFTRIFEFDPKNSAGPARDLAQAIPAYPASRTIKASDREEIQGLMAKGKGNLSVYSFPYLWGKSAASDYKVSQRDGLVLMSSTKVKAGRQSYMEPIGGTPAERAALIEKILAEPKGDDHVVFEYISPEVAKLLGESGRTKVAEAPDAAEYVYTTKDLVELQSTKKLRDKQKQVATFWALPNAEYKSLNDNVSLLPKVMEYLDHWVAKKMESGATGDAFTDEVETTRRMTQNFLQLGLKGGVVLVDGNVAGFTLGAPVGDKTYAVFIEKASPEEFPNAYQALNQSFAKDLQKLGVEHINRQDDEGVPGLRQAKRSYNPTKMEQHFIVTKP